MTSLHTRRWIDNVIIPRRNEDENNNNNNDNNRCSLLSISFRNLTTERNQPVIVSIHFRV